MRRVAALCLLLAACDDGAVDAGPDAGPDLGCPVAGACLENPERPGFSPPVVVAPSPDLPAEVVSQTAHNNLDVVLHDGRLFLALRTAPSHFASADTWLYVVSTTDQVAWRYEGGFHLGRDLREPRFLSINGELSLYFAVLGTDPLAFEPGGARVARYRGPGDWTPPVEAFADLPGFIPWRIQRHGDEAWLIGYVGGEGVYTAEVDPLRVYWLKTRDGQAWAPVAPTGAQVLEGGVSETDFARLDDGTIIAVGRNEAGDADGFGSKICRGEAATPGVWRCVADPRKPDSPLVLTDGARVWLVGRRHVTEDGHFDLGREDLPPEQQWATYLAAYWSRPKRCALWSVDATRLAVTHVLDLPSAGDTCFASAVPLGDRQWLLYNYSSPFDRPDISWIQGQRGPTLIYQTTLALP
ncbi:MAG: hypothetical protein KC549_03245 [Myxococcales bacterium]|nr:hypothetical protein [Myxococcales bacterium]